MTQTCAIIGGAGFLGQHLLHALLSTDSSIIIIDKTPFEKLTLMYPEDFQQENVKLHLNIDITNSNLLTEILAGVDVVFHLAALIAYGRKNKDLLNEVNTEGTKKIIQSSQANSVKQIIYVSSFATVGCLDEKDKNKLASEEAPKDWSNDFCYYGRSKYEGEEAVLNAVNLKPIIVLPGILIGPGPCHHASSLPFQIALHKKWTLVPQGGSNYIDVRDVAAALVAFSQSTAAPGKYLIVSNNLEHRELLQQIAAQGNHPIRCGQIPRIFGPFILFLFTLLEWILPRTSPFSKEGIMQAFKYRYFNHQKATDAINWTPKYTLQQTLQDTINWLNK